jgi:hypothetical protein
MATRKEILLEIEKSIQAQPRLQAELVQLEKQEKEAQLAASENVLAGNGSNAEEQLVQLRIRKETTAQALELAKQKILQGRTALVDLERAEIGGRWPEIYKDMRARQKKIVQLTVALQAELEGLRQALPEADRVSHFASQDAEIYIGRIRALIIEGLNGVDQFKHLTNFSGPGME